MAVGTTNTHLYRRSQLVRQALRTCRAVKAGVSPDQNMMQEAIHLLNEIVREEDQDFTGNRTALHGIAKNYVLLTAGVYIYSSSVGGLATDVKDIIDVQYRDSSGADHHVDYVSEKQFAQLSPQNEVGDVEKVCLVEDRVLTTRTLKVWPVPSAIATPSGVVGTDSLQYTCILPHTADTNNKPITGSQYSMFWKQTGSGGSVWATSTEYTCQELLVITYRRPLYEFTDPESDPDMQYGWGNYLKWRLALELASTYKIPADERAEWRTMRDEARQRLFPNSKVKTQDIHNKALYY